MLRLDDKPVIPDLNETAEYAAVTRKLKPVTVALKPKAGIPQMNEKTTGPDKLPKTMQPSLPEADDRTQNYDSGETNYLADIMQNVRKIAATVTVPLAMAASPAAAGEIPTPNISDAYNVENIRGNE